MKFYKDKNFVLKILIATVVIVIILGILYYVLRYKVFGIKYEEIDKSNLGITENVYENVSDNISKAEFDNIRNIVLFGIDSRNPDNFYSGRSDTIIIASINTSKKSMKFISIPRDTYVNIAGHGMDKINHAYAFGGEELSINTINTNFSLDITEYVTIDFSGLKNIIDKVGGVTVNIDEDELAFINNNSKVKLEHSGDVVLNGEQALIHSRNRTVGNDFSRAERQRNILVSLIQKIYSMESDEILSLSIYFLSQVKTNVTDYVDYGNSIISDKKEYLNNIISVQIPSTEYSEGKYIDGIYYFTTDLEKAKQDMYKYLYEQ